MQELSLEVPSTFIGRTLDLTLVGRTLDLETAYRQLLVAEAAPECSA